MQSQCIFATQTPVGPSVEIIRHSFSANAKKTGKRVSLVTGLHGDELEGLYICHRLMGILKEREAQNALQGEVHVYPAANPQALDSGTRLWPFFSVDINRTFGENNTHSLATDLSKALLADLKSNSDLVVDFHASNLQLMELPQIRIIKDFEKKLVPLAQLCNVDLIWVHPHADIFESTLGTNLNQAKIPTLVIEAGICLRINKTYCEQIILGILNLLEQTGTLQCTEPRTDIKNPKLLQPHQVAMVQSPNAGLFVKSVEIGQALQKGDKIGDLIDSSQKQKEIIAPCSGLLFTLREYPTTGQGAPLARIAIEETS